MGKLKAQSKQKLHAARATAHPYARPEEQAQAAMSTDEPAPSGTRGAILQRHKIELKKLKKELEQLQKERSKLSKKKHDSKADRKKMTQEMKQKEEDLLARHKQELEAWDAQAKAAGGTAAAEPQLKKNGYPMARRRRNRGKKAAGEDGMADEEGAQAPAAAAAPGAAAGAAAGATAPAPGFTFSLPAPKVALEPGFGGGMDTS
eukprot:tig00020614_g12148.t1